MAGATGFPRRQVNCCPVRTFGWRNSEGSRVSVIPDMHITGSFMNYGELRAAGRKQNKSALLQMSSLPCAR